MQRRTLPVVCTLLFLMLTCTVYAEPWAQTVQFQPTAEFGTLAIPNGNTPTSKAITFPSVAPKSDVRVVLRFRARADFSIPSGWNNFLGVNLNGKQLGEYTANGTPRLINRENEIRVDEGGKVYGVPYWGSVQGLDASLLVYMGPGGTDIDPRIRTERDELYWYMVDITDLVHYGKKSADNVTAGDVPNTLVFTNNLLSSFIRGDSRDIVLDDLAVGYVSLKDVQTRWKGRVYQFTALANPKAVLRGNGFKVLVGAGGSLQLVGGEDVYDINSSFSYPAAQIGFNALSEQPGKNQHPDWKVVVQSAGKSKAIITAGCDSYRIERTVQIKGHRVSISDRFTNTAKNPVGIVVENSVAAPEPFTNCLFGGVADAVAYDRCENPTTFIETAGGRLGVVAEDDVIRLQLAQIAQPSRAIWKTEHFGLDAGKNYTMKWSLYPYGKDADYWAFINHVRKDWKVNYRIDGPWDFMDVTRNRQLLDDIPTLKKYLARKKTKIVALTPWLDYDNFNMFTEKLVTRDEYRQMMQHAAQALRKADPSVLVTGCIESFPIQLSVEDSRIVYDRLPKEQQYHGAYPLVSKEMLEGLKGVNSDVLAGLTQNADGKYTVEVYYRWPAGTDGSQDKTKPVPLVALSGYPAPGNAQQAQLMDQAQFLIKECGLDGLYIDCFTLAYTGGLSHQRYDYRSWDGATVDIDSSTGGITRRYTDAGLVGGKARAELINYVLKEGGSFTAHSYPVCSVEQTIPSLWFSESEWCFEAINIGKGEKPPFFYRMCSGHLSTPVSLSSEPYRFKEKGDENYARVTMKSVITYLRHGGLTYYYGTDIPETGTGAGDYGPLHHMFPFTPEELHEGWVVGKERIITTVSATYTWRHSRKPKVLVFDINGRQIPAKAEISPSGKGWSVKLSLEDWENVSVIE